MKSNKVVTVLVVIMLILMVVLMGTVGLIWYRSTHVFVEGEAYSMKAESLDLRAEDISFAHYDSLHRQLPRCTVLWNVPFQGRTVSSDAASVTVTALSEEDLSVLTKYFPMLKTVDAMGCSDYVMLEKLIAMKPELEVRYQVSLGSAAFAPDTDALVLEPGDYDYDTLLQNLPHLPRVTTIQLKMPELTLEQLSALREAFPGITITCTVDILGTEYDTETTELDLSAMTGEDVPQVAEKLPMLTGLKNVELNNGEGTSQLAMEDVKALMEAAPEVKFHYTFDFFGTAITTTDEEVIVKNTRIGDDKEDQVRMALDLMQNCKRFVLDNCKLSNDVMAKLREDYREKTKVVWRIWFGEGTSLTDAEILRSTYNVDDDNCHDLIYLEDVKYMDIGHNEYLDNIPFVAGMKSLEVVIISGAPVHDLTPFKNCPNLRILEMANCLYAPDLTPLAECKKLEMLNISFTKVEDLSPLDELELTYLCGVHNKVSAQEQKRFMELHPDCQTKFQGDNPYSQGWRYDEHNERLPWYEDITQVFRYPKAPNNVGWYLDK